MYDPSVTNTGPALHVLMHVSVMGCWRMAIFSRNM